MLKRYAFSLLRHGLVLVSFVNLSANLAKTDRFEAGASLLVMQKQYSRAVVRILTYPASDSRTIAYRQAARNQATAGPAAIFSGCTDWRCKVDMLVVC